MTEDGSKVFFTTDRSAPPPTDTDHSADIYEAEVDTGAGHGHLSDADLDRHRRHRATPTPAIPPPTPPTNTGTRPAPKKTAASSRSAAAVASPRATATIYFLSPEQLDGSGHGVQNAPNLYVARPGSAPQFVATLESSSNAPLPPPPIHSCAVLRCRSQTRPGVAIDHATGDVYVLDAGTRNRPGVRLQIRPPSGTPVLSFGTNGKLNRFGTCSAIYELPTQIAVDNDPSQPVLSAISTSRKSTKKAAITRSEVQSLG